MRTREGTSAIWRTSEVLMILIRRPFKRVEMSEMSPSIHVTKHSHTHSPERRNNPAQSLLSSRQIARALTGERPRTGFKRWGLPVSPLTFTFGYSPRQHRPTCRASSYIHVQCALGEQLTYATPLRLKLQHAIPAVHFTVL